VRLLDGTKTSAKKDGSRKSESKKSTKSNSVAINHLKSSQNNINRNSSKSREGASEIYVKVKKEVTDTTHTTHSHKKNVLSVDLTIKDKINDTTHSHKKNVLSVDLTGVIKTNNGSSPKSGGKHNVSIQKYSATKTSNFNEFNKNTVKSKNNPLSVSSSNLLKVSNNKTHHDNSFNESKVKSSNISFEKQQKEEKDKNIVMLDEKDKNAAATPEEKDHHSLSNSTNTKSSHSLVRNIEVDSPEELHYFYVNIFNKNKNLAYKFEGEHIPDRNEEIKNSEI